MTKNCNNTPMPKPPPFTPTCILGLGNPGVAYKDTYHSVGFRVVDALAEKLGCDAKKLIREKHFEYWRADGRIIARSRTYMNNSGLAARDMLKKFDVSPARLLIVHDDSDLRLGTVRYAFGRGAAGHHGVLSVIERLHTKMVWRARIGIRVTSEKAERFVLRKMREEDKDKLYGVLDAFVRKVTEKENP